MTGSITSFGEENSSRSFKMKRKNEQDRKPHLTRCAAIALQPINKIIEPIKFPAQPSHNRFTRSCSLVQGRGVRESLRPHQATRKSSPLKNPRAGTQMERPFRTDAAKPWSLWGKTDPPNFKTNFTFSFNSCSSLTYESQPPVPVAIIHPP